MNVIIIPAYQPDNKLNQLVNELLALHFQQIVVIDDGSSVEHQPLFSALAARGCHVLHHAVNAGKGAAIKTGIRYASEQLSGFTGYVTCDADGQHPAPDILNVSIALDANPAALILGTRDFSQKNVPAKSRLGNRFSSFYFKATTGMTCLDTQTGLRGIPAAMTGLALAIPGNRYDYEMSFLLRVAKDGNKIMAVPITTVYLDDNISSHFRPFVDSVKIYIEPIKFALSSLLCAGVDLGLFTLLSTVLSDHIFKVVFIATVAARVVSGILNFLLNRMWSFRNKSPIQRQFLRYFALYLVQLGLSIAFVSLLAFLPIHLTVIKLFVDGLLFVGSFFIQKHWVFRKHKTSHRKS